MKKYTQLLKEGFLEKMNDTLAVGLIIAGFLGLITLIAWFDSKRQAEIQRIIFQYFSPKELKEIRTTLDSDPDYRKYKRDLEYYIKLKYQAKAVQVKDQDINQLKNVMSEVYSDGKVKDIQYEIDKIAKELLPTYYKTIMDLDDILLRKYSVTSGILY